jgi:Phage integrase, N-terminal SAM-like domain
MSALRQRMIDDMKLAGLSAATHAIYINAIRGLAAHYRRSPDELSEEEVRASLLKMRERGAARGTFKANHYGIQFLYRSTLNRDWALFSKKRSACPSRSASPMRSAMPKFAIFSLGSGTRSTKPAAPSSTPAVCGPERQRRWR